MRLAVTADLHWGVHPGGDRATRALVQAVRDWSPDALALAGDVGEGEQFGACLRLFSGVEGARLVVPGNHDLWLRGPDTSSLDYYEQTLPAIAAQNGFHYLDLSPWVAPPGDLSILGSINWYDYSFADPALLAEFPDAEAMYRRKQFPGGWHSDGRFVRLGMSDQDFTGRVVERLAGQLAALPDRISRVILIQHHPPVRELFYPTPAQTADQRFWYAYTGNRRMDALVRTDPRVSWVVCGHVHAACSADLGRASGRNVGGDYAWKRLLLLDTDTGQEIWQEFGRSSVEPPGESRLRP